MLDITSFQPLFDRILVEELAPESTTKGGLVIPDNAKEKASRGIVRVTGTGTVTKEGGVRRSSLKPGDRVQFRYYQGSLIEIDEKPFRLIREGDILVVEEDGD